MKGLVAGFMMSALFLLNGTVKADSLVVGIDDEYRPHYWTEHGQIVGPAIDVCKAVLKELGHEVLVKVTPWTRVLHELEKGGSDFVCLFMRKQDREKYSYFANEPVSENRYQLIASANSDFQWDGDYSKLMDKPIFSVRGWAYPLFFDKDFKRVDFDNERLVVRGVALNENAIGIGQYDGLRNAAEILDMEDRIRFLQPQLPVHTLFTGFSKKKQHKELAEQYARHLKSFKKTDAYREIYRRYNMQAPVWSGDKS